MGCGKGARQRAAGLRKALKREPFCRMKPHPAGRLPFFSDCEQGIRAGQIKKKNADSQTVSVNKHHLSCEGGTLLI